MNNMKNLPADLVNKVLIDINEEYKKKIKELEAHIECLQCQLDDTVDFMISNDAICCEHCDTWGFNDAVRWCADKEEHLCEECRS